MSGFAKFVIFYLTLMAGLGVLLCLPVLWILALVLGGVYLLYNIVL